MKLEKIIKCFCMIIVATAAMCISVYAADVGCEFPLSVVSDSVTTAMTVDDCRENRWVSEYGITALSLMDDRRSIHILGDTISAYLPLENTDLSRYGSMSINLYAVGEGVAEIAVTGFGADHTAHVECGKWYRVYISLASAVHAESIRISATGAESLYIGGINTTTEDQASWAVSMTCERMRTVVGESADDKRIKPTADGSVEIVAHGVLFQGGGAVVRVTAVTGAKGTLTFSVLTDEVGKGYADCGTVNLREGKASYLFYVRDPSKLKSYRLRFSGMGTEDIQLSAVTLYPWTDSFIGRSGTLAVRRSGESLELGGTLDNDTCVKYIDGTLALYEVPCWMSEADRFATEPLAISGVSTKFIFRADSSSMLCPPELCRFVAAIITADERIVPVTHSTSLGGTATGQSIPFFGMSTTDGMGILECTADYTVVDMSIDSFETGVGSGRLHSYGGRYYNMNSDVLKSMDKAVRTARVSGGGIFIRIGGLYEVSGEDTAYRLCALTDFLCSRYSDLSGIMIGSMTYSRAVFDYADRVKGSAVAYQLISAAASKYIQPFRVIIPIDVEDSPEDGGLICGMLTLALRDSGGSSFTAMYSIAGDSAAADDGADRCRLIYLEASTLGYSSSLGMMLSWRPDESMTASDIARGCENIISAGSASPAVSLMLEGCSRADLTLFDALYSMDRGVSYRSYIGEASVSDVNSSGSVDLWNFTSSYSTHGWIAAGLCTEVKTQINSFLSGITGNSIRVLKAAFSENSAGIATAAGRRELAADISGADAVEIYLLATGHRDNVPLTITFGAKGELYRYTADLPSGVPSYVKCAIPDSASKLDYFYITSLDSNFSEVDVVRISSVSKNGTGSVGQLPPEQKNDTPQTGYYIAIMGIVFTALIFVAVARKDKNMTAKGS